MKIDKLWNSGPGIFGLIYGNLPSKGNSRQIVKVRGRALVIKSKAARDWEEAFGVAIRSSNLTGTPWPKEAMRLEVDAYYDSLRQDIEVELLKDALQRAGVVENDRYIFEVRMKRMVDRENPRVEFMLSKLADRSEWPAMNIR